MLSEQYLLDDMLSTEKSMVKDYSTYCTEISCENMRSLVQNQMIQCSNDQFAIFNQMRSRGMYQIKEAQPQDVTQAKQKAQQMSTQF